MVKTVIKETNIHKLIHKKKRCFTLFTRHSKQRRETTSSADEWKISNEIINDLKLSSMPPTCIGRLNVSNRPMYHQGIITSCQFYNEKIKIFQQKVNNIANHSVKEHTNNMTSHWIIHIYTNIFKSFVTRVTIKRGLIENQSKLQLAFWYAKMNHKQFFNLNLSVTHCEIELFSSFAF